MQIKTVVSFAAFLLTCAIPIPLAGAGVPAADVQPAAADAAVTDARSAAISETADYCDPEYGWLLTTDIDTLTKFLAENGVETDAGSAELITETVHDWFLHQSRPVSGDEDELRLHAQIYCALDRYSGRHMLGCELAWLGEAELRRYLSRCRSDRPGCQLFHRPQYDQQMGNGHHIRKSGDTGGTQGVRP